MATGRRTVLVVDDEPTIAEIVARYLERAGYARSAPPTASRRSAGRRASTPTWSSST